LALISAGICPVAHGRLGWSPKAKLLATSSEKGSLTAPTSYLTVLEQAARTRPWMNGDAHDPARIDRKW